MGRRMKYFRFHDEEQEKSHYLELSGLEVGEQEMDNLFYSVIRPEMENRNLEERYGVHDVSFNGVADTIWGFTTYEVEYDKWFELMQEWRQILTLAGFNVGAYFCMIEDEEHEL